MKLEDLTKDELIYVIRHNWRHFNERMALISALDARQQRLFKLYKVEEHISQDYLQQYTEFLKKHEGEPLVDLPIEELKSAQKAFEAQREHEKKARRYYKESQACYHTANRLLEEGTRK